VFHKLRNLFRIALGLYLERKRVSGPEENCRDLQEVEVMAGYRGKDKTQEVLTDKDPASGSGSSTLSQEETTRVELDAEILSEDEQPRDRRQRRIRPTDTGQDRILVTIPVKTPAIHTTVADKAVNDIVKRILKGDFDNASAGEMVEAFNQNVQLSTVAGRTGSPSEFSGVSAATGLSVAQTSLFERAQAALADAQRRLVALKPMQTPSDPENLDTVRVLTLSVYKRLVRELGRSGGPRDERTEMYFTTLIGVPKQPPTLGVGSLLDQIKAQFNINIEDVNSQEDSANVASFHNVRDYLFDLRRSWEAFVTDRGRDFGQRAARFSQLLLMIQDDVADVETAMDEVNFDSLDRDTFEIEENKPLTIHGLLSWIAEFAAEEGPEIVDEGGVIGIKASVKTLDKILELIGKLIDLEKFPVNEKSVKASLEALEGHLQKAQTAANTITAPPS
jgi:hypothetical protein